MTGPGDADVPSARTSPAAREKISASLRSGALALPVIALLATIALVPDEAVLRPKVVWGQGAAWLLLGCALIQAAWSGRLVLPWSGVLVAGLGPVAAALALMAGGVTLSRSLAVDETARILLVTCIVASTGSLLGTAAARRMFLGALLLLCIPVAALALAQNLAGVLQLPLDRAARATSTFGNPVFLGAFLVLTLPLCAAGALFGTGTLRWAGALATGLGLPALLATQSRWAWLGFAGAVTAGILLLTPPSRLRRWLLGGLFLAGAVLAVATYRILLRPQYHALIWRDTWALVEAHPWGVGPGQFQLAFLPFASPELLDKYPRASVIINDAHCEPLQILAELGWIGLLAVLVWLGLILFRSLRSLHRLEATDPERPYLAAAVAALIGSSVQSLGSPDLRFLISTMVFATLIGLAAAIAGRPVTGAERPAGRAMRAPFRLLFAAAGLCVIGVAGHETWERQSIGSLVRPRAPFRASSGSTERLRTLLRQVDEDPRNPVLHFDLGVALAEAHRYHDATAAFNAAAALDPGRPSTLRNLGIVEAQSGQYGAAVGHLRATLASYPEDHELRYLLAYSAYGLGDIATAIRELEALLDLQPEHPQGRLLLEKLRE